jgi:hypothetical protein
MGVNFVRRFPWSINLLKLFFSFKVLLQQSVLPIGCLLCVYVCSDCRVLSPNFDSFIIETYYCQLVNLVATINCCCQLVHLVV